MLAAALVSETVRAEEDNTPRIVVRADQSAPAQAAPIEWRWGDRDVAKGIWMSDVRARAVNKKLTDLETEVDRLRVYEARQSIPWWAWGAAGLAGGVALSLGGQAMCRRVDCIPWR